jgi:hypothetical protein
MKVVLDFDDVLFKTNDMKEFFIRALETKGIDREITEHMYAKHRGTGIPFSLKRFLWTIAVRENIPEIAEHSFYENLLTSCPTFLNHSLVALVSSLGKENMYILTHGDEEYQMEKIARTLGGNFAKEIIVVTGSKRERLASICDTYPEEEIIFIEDKQHVLNDIEPKKNLTTILFDYTAMSKIENVLTSGLV